MGVSGSGSCRLSLAGVARKVGKLVFFGFTIVTLATCALISVHFAVSAWGDSATDGAPTFIGDCYGPDVILSDIVRERGGLPKESVDLAIGEDVPESIHIYPVAGWSVDNVEVGSSFSVLETVLDDDPTYSITATIRVQYADASEGMLRWSSWRYGMAFGSMVMCRGDGPPGRIEFLEVGD